MATYIILSNLSPDAVDKPSDFPALAREVADRIRKDCPSVKWKDSYALMGAFDVLDIVEADSAADVERAAMIIRSYGHASTETFPATPWASFVKAMGAKSAKKARKSRR